MSINGMTNMALRRRPDFGASRAERTTHRINAQQAFAPLQAPAQAGETVPARTGTGQHTAASDAEADGVQTALHVIFGYIPTEVVTIYTALNTGLGKGHSQTAAWWLFGISTVMTPLIVVLIFAGKARSQNKPMPSLRRRKSWPQWEMTAATIAFVAWAYSLPGSPFQALAIYADGTATLAVVITSTMLGLMAPVFQSTISTPQDNRS